MKKNLFLFLMIFVCQISNSQTWDWASGFGGLGMERSWDLAKSGDSVFYITGQFSDTLIINELEFPSNGLSDVFIIKFNNLGEVIWVRTFGGVAEDIGVAIDTDEKGNVYTTGYFNDTLLLNEVEYVAASWDLFLIKFSANGEYQWFKHPTTENYDLGYGISCSGSGVYITGWFNGDNFVIDDDTLNSYGSSDILIVKYDTVGNYEWMKQAGCSAVDYAFKIATNSNGDCYVSGIASEFALFDSQLLGYDGMFVAKYNKFGEFQSLAACENASMNSITFSESGVGYVTGRFNSVANFIGDENITINGFENSDDVYLAQFDENCVWNWAVVGTGAGSDKGRAVYSDNVGNAYLTGTFVQDLTFGDLNLIGEEQDNIYVVKYDNNQNPIWIMQGGGSNADVSTDIIVGDDGYPYVTGWYSGESVFGKNNLFASSETDMNIYIAKIDTSAVNLQSIKKYNISSIYPNPCKNNFKLFYQNDLTQNEEVIISLCDVNGTNIFSENEVLLGGINEFEYNCQSLKNGIYFLNIKNNEINIKHKIIIIK